MFSYHCIKMIQFLINKYCDINIVDIEVVNLEVGGTNNTCATSKEGKQHKDNTWQSGS